MIAGTHVSLKEGPHPPRAETQLLPLFRSESGLPFHLDRLRQAVREPNGESRVLRVNLDTLIQPSRRPADSAL